MTEAELQATVADARAQIAAMPEWKQRWLRRHMGYNGKPPANQPMGHIPPPPPPQRRMAQSGTATARNLWAAQAALEAVQGMGANQPAGILTAENAQPAKPEPKKKVGSDLSKPRKRKITLE